jgi:hypothetical protein
MTKTEIIKAIAEQSHHESVKGLFGGIVVNACIEELNKPFDLERVKTLIDSASYLINQIETCNKCAKLSRLVGPSACGMTEEDYLRQSKKYTESLIKTIEEL